MLKSYLSRWLRSARAQWPFYLGVLALALLCRGLWASSPKEMAKALQAIAKAQAAGEAARTEDYVQVWLPRVARVHFVVCLALLVSGPWLVGRDEVKKTVSAAPRNRALWWLTGLMIALSALMNYPRLSHSFWADEEWTARRFVVGEFRNESDFRVPSWTKTLFFYRDPNNHPLYSALAKISHSMVAVPQAKDQFYFREWAIRLPAFLFGLGGLAAVAWLGSLLGMPRAGMIAVVWLALHPWHVRYGVDARGYALLLTLLPLCMGFLWRANATGGMTWWLAYGLAEFLVLWAYPGALYFVAMLNVAACGMIFTSEAPIAKSLQWRRFAAGNVMGALLTSLLLAPCVQPMLIYLKGGRIHGVLTGGWVVETLSGLFTGIPWSKWEDHELAISWIRTWDQAPWLVLLVVAVLLAVLVAGVAAMLRQTQAHRWLAGLILLSGPFMFFMAKAQGNILYPWYLIICLPGMAVVMGAGVEFLATFFKGSRLECVLPAGLLALFGGITWGQNQVLRQHPIEPMGESVAVTRAERNARTVGMDKVLTGSLCFPARLYDPMAVAVNSVTELRALMDQADAKSLPLFINFADKEFLKLRDPALVAVLDDISLFQAMPPFLGIHGQRERRVYRYLGKK